MDELLTILKNLRPDVDFETNERLIDDGILDSLDIVALVSELNDCMDIDISVEHLIPENFNSAKAIMALIQSLQD
jgi:D-alanine--poly(phosphoribitol) ligase subunit 2